MGQGAGAMNQIPIDAISDILALDPNPRSYEELDRLTSAGLKKSTLKACVSNLCSDENNCNRILYQIIPKTDFLSERDCLTPDESMRVVRFARILAAAQYIWSSDQDAKEFMNHAHAMVDDMTPIEAAWTEAGTRRMEEVLWKIFYGSPV
jgi:putative toxin-antitoxin system antitoxin component (TIGR02293 family)